MSEESYTGFFIEGIEQWSQMLPGYNWRTFHVIMVEVEDDRMMGGVECTFIVLGLGFRARWNYRRTEQVEDLLERMDDIKSGRVETVPLGSPRPQREG